MKLKSEDNLPSSKYQHRRLSLLHVHDAAVHVSVHVHD